MLLFWYHDIFISSLPRWTSPSVFSSCSSCSSLWVLSQFPWPPWLRRRRLGGHWSELFPMFFGSWGSLGFFHGDLICISLYIHNIYIEICISNKYLTRESMSFFPNIGPICHGPFTNHPLVQVPLKSVNCISVFRICPVFPVLYRDRYPYSWCQFHLLRWYMAIISIIVAVTMYSWSLQPPVSPSMTPTRHPP